MGRKESNQRNKTKMTFWRHFPYAMQYYLVSCALQRHVRLTMQNVVISAEVDRHMSQSGDVYL